MFLIPILIFIYHSVTMYSTIFYHFISYNWKSFKPKKPIHCVSFIDIFINLLIWRPINTSYTLIYLSFSIFKIKSSQNKINYFKYIPPLIIIWVIYIIIGMPFNILKISYKLLFNNPSNLNIIDLFNEDFREVYSKNIHKQIIIINRKIILNPNEKLLSKIMEIQKSAGFFNKINKDTFSLLTPLMKSMNEHKYIGWFKSTSTSGFNIKHPVIGITKQGGLSGTSDHYFPHKIKPIKKPLSPKNWKEDIYSNKTLWNPKHEIYPKPSDSNILPTYINKADKLMFPFLTNEDLSKIKVPGKPIKGMETIFERENIKINLLIELLKTHLRDKLVNLAIISPNTPPKMVSLNYNEFLTIAHNFGISTETIQIFITMIDSIQSTNPSVPFEIIVDHIGLLSNLTSSEISEISSITNRTHIFTPEAMHDYLTLTQL